MNIRCIFLKVTYSLFLFVLLALVGCSTGTSSVKPDEIAGVEPTKTISTPTTMPKVSPTLQPTYTAVPAVPAATFTPLPLPTQTPLPTATLTSEQKNENLTELMQTNGGCQLPCWWGIVPGETLIETAKEMLLVNGFRWSQDYSAGIRGANDFGVFLELEAEGATVQSLRIRGDYLTGTEDSLAYSQAFARGWQQFGMMELFGRYGLPTRVFVYSPFRADPGNGSSYHLLLFYEELGIEIDYRGNAEQLNAGRYHVCPNLEDIWEINLFLYQPGQVSNVIERVLPSDSISYIAGTDILYDLISWQQATDTSLELFYETFMADPNTCFEFEIS